MTVTPSPDACALRPFTPEYLEPVIALDARLTGHSRRGFYTRHVAAAARDPGSLCSLVVLRDGEVVGVTVARITDGEFGAAHPSATIEAIAIAPEARGQGLAHRVLETLAADLVQRGVVDLQSEADWSESEMVRFFAAAGFALTPHQILGRPVMLGNPAEDPALDGPDLAEDLEMPAVEVRSLEAADLPAIIALDRRITHRDRAPFYTRKGQEMLADSGLRVSLVAETAGELAGFVMARVDYGDFGRTDPTAVIDTLGVAPHLGRRGVGRALVGQLLRNLGSLRVERAVTRVAWDDLDLRGFLKTLAFAPCQRLCFARVLAPTT